MGLTDQVRRSECPGGVIDFLGLPIDDLDAARVAELVASRPAGQNFAYIVTPNAQHVVNLSQDRGVWRQAYSRAWLRLCDGHVMQPLARLLFGLRLPHASGSDITMLLLKHHIRPDDPVTVIGGSPELERALRDQYGWRNLALYTPPFGLLQDRVARERCVDFLADHPARYVFITVGSPQSEYLASLAAGRGGLAGTCLCVGGSLMFATGLIKRAPVVLRKFGLEGMFRLVQRPRAHFRRVFIESMPVVGLLLRARFGKGEILPRSGERPA